MATFELYRMSSIGICLIDALDEMVENGTLSPELAVLVVLQFDKSMVDALENQVKSKVSVKDLLVMLHQLHPLGKTLQHRVRVHAILFQGQLHTYRFCDHVWTFIIKDVILNYLERRLLGKTSESGLVKDRSMRFQGD